MEQNRKNSRRSFLPPVREIHELGLRTSTIGRLTAAGVQTVARVKFHGKPGLSQLAESGSLTPRDVTDVQNAFDQLQIPWSRGKKGS